VFFGGAELLLGRRFDLFVAERLQHVADRPLVTEGVEKLAVALTQN
jgi:hypothetical protein